MTHNQLFGIKYFFILGIPLLCSSCFSTYLTTESDFNSAHTAALSYANLAGYRYVSTKPGYEQSQGVSEINYRTVKPYHLDTFLFEDGRYYELLYQYEITEGGSGTAYVVSCSVPHCTLDNQTCDSIESIYGNLPTSNVRELPEGSQVAVTITAWTLPLLLLMHFMLKNQP